MTQLFETISLHGRATKSYQCPDLSEADWAYVAGILDGEGYIGWVVRHPKGKTGKEYPKVSVGNTSKGLIDWLHLMLGGSTGQHHRAEPKPNHNPAWTWELTTYASIYAVLSKVLPYLLIKRDKAIETLELLEKRGVVCR